MKNSNSESLEKKALSDKEINSDSSSEKTEDEIIYNNCIDPEEEEFLETEKKSETNIPEENNNIGEKIQPQKDLLKNTSQKSRKNKFHDYYSPKFDFARKKRNKPEEVKTADDLFVQALQKNKTMASINVEYDKQGNTMSTKISDKIYDKYVGQNCLSGDIIDIAKMKDEESNIKRDALKARENARKINDMINRQDKYETLKKHRLKEREQLYNDKINQECVFMPNGAKILNHSIPPEDFYANEMKFLKKKKEFIQKENETLLEEEKRKLKVNLLNKTSEKLASNKNPNESKEQLYQRLHFEKLKNVKVMYKKPEQEKKITKKQANNLINKLYKERLTLKENKEKKIEEKFLKETSQDEYISENSNKVLLTKFLNYYNNTLQKIFNRNDNFQINIDEYKLILQHMGCINPNLQSDEALIKESFFNILNPKDDKIDTYTLLLFCLAALGIYKGNDDKKLFESTNIYKYNNNSNSNSKNNKPKQNSLNNSTRLSGKKSQKIKITNFNELIKSNMPNLDMDKYGFSNKIAKNINKKFHTFVKGINDSWTGDITKKKQERYEKHDNNINQKVPRASSQNKKSTLRNLDNNTKLDININQKNNGKNNTIPVNSKNFDELYKRLNQKKEKNNLKCYKNKKELEEMGPCTFQPNVNKSNNNNSKEKNKNKLNSKQIDKNFEKLYQEGKASYLQKKKYSIEPDPEDNLENQINCTFKPQIHQFNNEVFINNPIKEELKKFEKIREQRMSDIANKEFEKTMNFVIEPKLNKEDIIDRVIPERFSYKNNICSNNNDISEKENEVDNALLKVEVNLDENNNTDKIIIYPGDDVKEKTLQFCQKHKLNEEKKNTLMNIIMEKIEETKNGINEEKNEENNNINNQEEENVKNNEENGNYEYIIEKKENNDEN